MILDPLLEWADVERENNRFPRQANPIAVAVSSSGRVLTTVGAPFAWVRATVREMSSIAAGANVWDFSRGLASPPSFARAGETAVAAHAEPGALNTIIALSADGSRHIVGEGTTPAVTPGGDTFAAVDDQVVKWSADGTSTTVLRKAGFKIEQPRPSNDGGRLAYIARRGNDLDIRVYHFEDGSDSSVLPWNGDRIPYSWSNNDTHLYMALGVGWDWQIWSVNVDQPEAPEILVAGAASISSIALSPDGERLAFAAVPAIEYPLNRHRLYVQPVEGGMVQTFELDGSDASAVAWAGNDEVLVVSRAMKGDNPWFLPAERKLQRVRLSDGTLRDLPLP
jgi:dipeptidyl aminopeptidase/acylaminoacyl peptidase